ncbi:MAG: SGNH/GDSL hydrolase family protein [Candidatus Paceibacterota bacterium]
MKLALGCLLVLVSIVIYFAYPLWRAIHVSKKIEEYTVAYEQHPNDPTLHILVAGDSTGVGTGASAAEDSTAGRIGKDFPNADIVNVSKNGITTEGLRVILDSMPNIRYDLIVIQIGANDVTSFAPEKQTAESLTQILDYAESHASSTVVLTAGNIGRSAVFKYPLSKLITSRTLTIRKMFQDEISKRSSVTFVDLFKNSVDETFNSDKNTYYAEDHFHPSSAGYGVWYQEIGPVIRKDLSS